MKTFTECQRQFAASVILDALKAMQILLDTRRTKEQYFEGVEALVWIVGEKSERFLEALGFEPSVVRNKLDLALYSECALEVFEEMRETMYRNYIKVVRYDLQQTSDLVPFNKIAIYAKDSVLETERILRSVKDQYHGKNGGRIALFLDHLSKLESTTAVRKAG